MERREVQWWRRCLSSSENHYRARRQAPGPVLEAVGAPLSQIGSLLNTCGTRPGKKIRRPACPPRTPENCKILCHRHLHPACYSHHEALVPGPAYKAISPCLLYAGVLPLATTLQSLAYPHTLKLTPVSGPLCSQFPQALHSCIPAHA